MRTPKVSGREVTIEGTVLSVDTVNRELTVLSRAVRVAFDVPPGCPIVLRGERVKLRLVQPGDRVRVTADGPRVASAVEVQPIGAIPPGPPERRPA